MVRVAYTVIDSAAPAPTFSEISKWSVLVAKRQFSYWVDNNDFDNLHGNFEQNASIHIRCHFWIDCDRLDYSNYYLTTQLPRLIWFQQALISTWNCCKFVAPATRCYAIEQTTPSSIYSFSIVCIECQCVHLPHRLRILVYYFPTHVSKQVDGFLMHFEQLNEESHNIYT